MDNVLSVSNVAANATGHLAFPSFNRKETLIEIKNYILIYHLKAIILPKVV